MSSVYFLRIITFTNKIRNKQKFKFTMVAFIPHILMLCLLMFCDRIFPWGTKTALVTLISHTFMFSLFVEFKYRGCCKLTITLITGISNTLMLNLFVEFELSITA